MSLSFTWGKLPLKFPNDWSLDQNAVENLSKGKPRFLLVFHFRDLYTSNLILKYGKEEVYTNLPFDVELRLLAVFFNSMEAKFMNELIGDNLGKLLESESWHLT